MRKSILFIILIACCTHLLGGCTFEDRLKDLEQRVTTLEEEYRQANEDIVALQQIVSVLQEQNYVTDIAPVTDDMGRNGYKISFSKSEPVTIYDGLDGENGIDGYTPQVSVAQEGDHYYWTIDGDWLLTEGGERIQASAIDGTTPQLKIEEEFWYVSYDNGENWIKLDRATPAVPILFTDIEYDSQYLHITLYDGNVLSLRIASNVAVSGIILWSDKIELDYKGEATLEFRVNPSNAEFTFDSIPERSDIVLDAVVTRSNVSYTTQPTRYTLTSVVAATDKEGNTRQGHYIATIKDNGHMLRYDDIVALVIKQKDQEGNEVLISSNTFNLYHAASGLPVVWINTPDQASINSKEVWLENTSIKIVLPDGTIDYEGTTDNIRGRGNSTWGYPKKPYALKLDSKSSLLGMPKHKRWVLLANWMDRTLLRNDVTFELSRRVEMDYTVRGQYVEVILNGEHKGNYYLCEQIKIDKNRVNITEMESTDVAGDAITGGYLIELDTHYDEVNKFTTPWKKLPVMIKEPDEDVINEQQLEYITNYFTEIEDILYGEAVGNIDEYIHYESFAKTWIINELTGSDEPNHPKSFYLTKDRNDLLKAGPVWDFDWGTYRPNVYISSARAVYYDKLFQNSEFVAVVKECWSNYKETLGNMEDYVNNQAALITYSEAVNYDMWPIDWDVNGDETMTHQEAVKRLIEAYKQKYQYLDGKISNM